MNPSDCQQCVNKEQKSVDRHNGSLDQLISITPTAKNNPCNRHQSHFLMLPNELITGITKILDFEDREAFRDVCKRFRSVIDQNETAIFVNKLSNQTQNILKSGTLCKFQNLRILHLVVRTKTTMDCVMEKTADRNRFAKEMASCCPLLAELRVDGIVGCKWLLTYVSALVSSGRECLIQKLEVDMQGGYIGCMQAMNRTIRNLKQLRSLTLICSNIYFRKNVTDITEAFYSHLGSMLKSFSTSFPSRKVDAIWIHRLTNLLALQSKTELSTEQLQSISIQNPALRTLRLTVMSTSSLDVHMFSGVERLSFNFRTASSRALQTVLQSAIKSLSKLRVLELTFYKDSGLELSLYIGQNNSIRVLIVNGNKFMSSESVVEAVRRLPNLSSLIVPDWTGSTVTPHTAGARRDGPTATVWSLMRLSPKLERVQTAYGQFQRTGCTFQRHAWHVNYFPDL